MSIQELLKQINDKNISEDEKVEKIKELQEYVKNQNEFHDDHGPVIIGGREDDPHFQKN